MKVAVCPGYGQRMIRVCVVAVLVAVLAGCGGGAGAAPTGADAGASVSGEDRCRATARQVFTEVADDRETVEGGQARVDAGCVGVDAVARAAIIDAEQQAVVARVMATATP